MRIADWYSGKVRVPAKSPLSRRGRAREGESVRFAEAAGFPLPASPLREEELNSVDSLYDKAQPDG
jgi:hypothetical protein